MNYLFIVIKHKGLVDTDKLLSFFHEHGPFIMTYEKPETNPHYHIILSTNKLVNTIRNSLTRKFQLTGSDRTTTLVKDLDKSLIYILKDNDIKHNNLLTASRLEELQLKTKEINKEKLEKSTKSQSSMWYKCYTTYKPIQVISSVGDFGETLFHNHDEIDNHITGS